MPTADQLSRGGHLKVWPHKLALGKPVVRNIYIGKRAEDWIREHLRELKADGAFHGVETPREQLADVFRRVMTGERIDRFRPKTLVGHPDWLHELRTPDLRVFGWFWRRTEFVVALVTAKSDLASKRVTYEGCLESCRADRNQLDLDPPKYIVGEIDDILGF